MNIIPFVLVKNCTAAPGGTPYKPDFIVSFVESSIGTPYACLIKDCASENETSYNCTAKPLVSDSVYQAPSRLGIEEAEVCPPYRATCWTKNFPKSPVSLLACWARCKKLSMSSGPDGLDRQPARSIITMGMYNKRIS
jgi:hypothetical protein